MPDTETIAVIDTDIIDTDIIDTDIIDTDIVDDIIDIIIDIIIIIDIVIDEIIDACFDAHGRERHQSDAQERPRGPQGRTAADRRVSVPGVPVRRVRAPADSSSPSMRARSHAEDSRRRAEKVRPGAVPCVVHGVSHEMMVQLSGACLCGRGRGSAGTAI
jgi:hypothetical protein